MPSDPTTISGIASGRSALNGHSWFLVWCWPSLVSPLGNGDVERGVGGTLRPQGRRPEVDIVDSRRVALVSWMNTTTSKLCWSEGTVMV